ncbi:MAG: ribonuclease HI [Actinomycetota bacterium]|nr:ribonuclease HI [Actinomycetota bacterium]
MIIAAADGSALGNPGPAGWAWYVDDDCWAAGGWPHATNNQGELKAVLELFRATAHLDDELLVLCDSQYVINAVTKWIAGWKRKGWRKADGKPVLNVELLQELDDALAGRRFRFEWVRGHVGHPLNEAADERARAVATAYQRGTEIPSGPGWTHAGVDLEVVSPLSEPSGPGIAVTAEPESEPDEATTGVKLEADIGDDDALFALDEVAEAWHTLTLDLSVEEHARLVRRARDAGVSPEEFLRNLI